MTTWPKLQTKFQRVQPIVWLVLALLVVVLLQSVRIYQMEKQQVAGDKQVLTVLMVRRGVRDAQFERIEATLAKLNQRLDALEANR